MDPARLLDHVEAWIERCRPLFAGPGIAFGLTTRDRTIGVRAIGESSPGVPLTSAHLFPIASVSKSFTAALVMQEVEWGRIRLDEPVATFLPWFRPPTSFAPITLHHLLTHTAGLASGYDVSGDAIHELLPLAEQELASAPGRHHVYSNAGYKALGLILEAVAGQPWWELARERLLEPLGMDATEPVMTTDVRPRLATGWVPMLDDRPWRTGEPLVHAPAYESFTADGTICSTAEEMCAYLRAYLTDGGPILSAGAVERMTTPVAPSPEGVAYGYGLWVRRIAGGTHVGHSGSLPGYRSFVTFDRSAGTGAVVLSNGDVGWEVRRDLLAFALDTIDAATRGAELPELPSPTERSTVEDPAPFAGRYSDEHGSVLVGGDGGAVTLSSDGALSALERVDRDVFAAGMAGWDRFPLSFERVSDRAVAFAYGPRLLRRDGESHLPPPPPDPEWEGCVGRYRAYGIEPMHMEVLVRAGAIRMLSPAIAEDDPLIPLGDGRFRVGEEPWRPGRARFETAFGSRATRVVVDGAPFSRVG